MSVDMRLTAEDYEVQKADPVPTRADQNGNRAQHFVQEISNHALLQLGELRDQIDDLCRQITAKQQELTGEIQSHIDFATTAIKAKLTIAKHVEEIAAFFPPKPKPTITQRNGGNHG